ncbi:MULTISPECIES: helix-turn-helix transcriptional regulator [unclassified Nocardia]|uniref:helix-turn-helix transcriptional regulator n=1 Tax=unclassified Nocardia TaxID=2637762 RepID=UPI001CE41113|nr:MULTISPECIES: helix-turn-helix transcriptional regulator [unclassified Nocardia]
MALEHDRRRTLGAFVRSRRERLDPGSLLLPGSPRRRTPGLRREEVAQLSGVSLSWYTWLEQGRDINVSRQVLDALARTLRLDPLEHRHLLRLAGSPDDTQVSEPPTADTHLRAVLAAFDPAPASLRDRHGDILARNRAESALFDTGDAYPNTLELYFAWQPMRTMLRDWAIHARCILAEFRAEADRYPGDDRFAEIVARLRPIEPFADWWDGHDVGGFTPTLRLLDHPKVGRLALRHSKLLAADDPTRHILVRTADDADTADRLSALVRDTT